MGSPMERTGFEKRRARVLASHATTRRSDQRRGARRLVALIGAFAATLACFFLLKGAALAWQGEEVFAASATAPDAHILRLWLTGPDPLTRLIADVLTPART
ncbi:MAG: Anti-sigma-K factor rskA [Rhodobacteraceae bacterium HLUCCA12]|nr:MAG: Anti-sigma-K factor rskA [Rhodobacteraceae bacterium HLUCCA12]